VRNLASVLLPLLLGTFDRIEAVSAAMELRGFGRGRRRTWLVRTPLRLPDLVLIGLAVLLVAVPIVLLGVNDGRFWNPFV
jgi:energy-coupling factor transport system permease protein